MVHDRFDADFTKTCMQLGIVHKAEDSESYNPDVQIGCA